MKTSTLHQHHVYYPKIGYLQIQMRARTPRGNQASIHVLHPSEYAIIHPSWHPLGLRPLLRMSVQFGINSVLPPSLAIVDCSRHPIAPKLSAMATAAPAIAFSSPAASFCASRGSNRSSIWSSSSVLAMPLKKQGFKLIVRAGEQVDVDVKEAGAKGDVLPSGEWPENFSMLNYEDLSKYYEDVLFKPEAQPSTHLADVMSKTITTASPEQALEVVDHHFAVISGLPVIDSDHRCIGVISKKDRAKARDLKAKVKDVMSSPAITLSANKIVSDAAILMLKNKIHRIPIVNDSNQVVGIVTRTDIFSALEGGKDK